MSSRCVWDDLSGQPKAARFLRKVVEDGLVSHAYLFAGPTGSGKKTAARALACALFCTEACGDCSVCRRVRRGTHPDFRVIRPEGAASYMVEQVRDVIREVGLRPVEAPLKVYVFEQAEAFNPQAANALLKTLEEPPRDVVVVLLVANYESVLPTITSRCQIVRFGRVPPSRAVSLLIERTGVSEEQALAALGASGWIESRALEYLRSPLRHRTRETTLRIMRDLCDMDGLDVLRAARELLDASGSTLAEVRKAHAEELSERREFLGKGASLRDLEERQKRELTAREREGLLEVLAVMESWLRDCLLLAVGAGELTLNRDELDVERAAIALTPQAAVRALEAVEAARRLISYNVSPQLAVETALFQVREVLSCPR